MRVAAKAVLVALGLALAAPVAAQGAWPAWESFRARFVADGRVIDPATEQRITTSEGQAYALFFALVANDRASFDRLLRWTEVNLAGGDLTARLPAWEWGRRDDGGWGVLDPNAAADADLWLAYSLGEAARIWGDARYRVIADALAARIVREESAALPKLGRTLLPGPRGFHWEEPERWRLNPSYYPLPVLRRMAVLRPGGEWAELERSARQVLLRSAPQGFAPDWAAVDGNGLRPADGRLGLGSYDAIRVYLWAGMLPPGDDRRQLLRTYAPMTRRLARVGVPPREVETREGAAQGTGPVGFSAALLPLLDAAGETQAVRMQESRVAADRDSGNYYDRALILFGLGWREGRYRFAQDGALVLP